MEDITQLVEEFGIEEATEKVKTCYGGKGGLKAANGLTDAITGTRWTMVKDFKGQPKHSQGGVDITISDKGVSMRRGGKDIKAEFGLVIPNNN